MDSALKQRLIGAAVLIALAVIFVPMFLGNAPPQPQNTTLNLDIPKPPDRDFQTRTLPVSGTESVATPAANPDKVASVTLINTGLLLDYNWHRLARIWRIPVVGELFMRASTRRLATLLLRHDNPGLSASWVRQIAEHLSPAATKRAVLRLYRSTRPEDMDALVEPLRDRDPETLVVFGAADVYIPVEQAERQRRVFPRARVEILPGVGHWAWLEQPDRVAEFVIPFLRERVGVATVKTN